MPKKKILLVGEWMLTEGWQRTLEKKGFDCAVARSMIAAVDYLSQSPDAARIQLLVQNNLPITEVRASEPRPYPQEFDVPKSFHRGQELIRYIREKGLISSESPAYLVASQHIEGLPEGVTRVLSNDLIMVNAAEQIETPLHRPDTRTNKRGT